MAGLSQRSPEVRKREGIVMEMLNASVSVEEIAEKIGCTIDAVYKIRVRVLSRYVEKQADEYRNEDLARLEALTRTLWPKARRGDVQAIDRLLKIMERKAKYTGADAPVEIKVESVDQDREEGFAIIQKFKAKPGLSIVEAS